MNIAADLPGWSLFLAGLVAGLALMRLVCARDKALLQQQLSTRLAVAETNLQHLKNAETDLKALQQQLTEAKTLNTELQTRLAAQENSHAEKMQLLQQTEQQLKLQFELLAGKIFDERSKQFTEHNKTSLDHIVSPLREQLGEFKRRLETIYDNENKDRISLREEIVSLRRDTAKLNQEALNLTNALKGDKKTQGNWGELVLERVLEKSGLRKGIEYEIQKAFRDEDHNLFRPDVIVRLPDNKDIIIDSKVSLLAYERYCTLDEEQERLTALKQHIEAVRSHLKNLGSKDYSQLRGLKSLDFILLFMPIEAAFMAAFQADERLFTDAFDHKIIVVTPTTLLATLRTIENIWRYERQNENARVLADKAAIIYNKIRGFVDDLDKLGKQLATVNNTYAGVMNKLTLGQGNLVRQASSFAELGVKIGKTLSKNIVDQALNEIIEEHPDNTFYTASMMEENQADADKDN